MTQLIVTIDGPAGAGKTTASRALAEAIGFAYLDTGAMYRALALKALANSTSLDDPEPLIALLLGSEISVTGTVTMLDGRNVSQEIRVDSVSTAASKVAQHPDLREVMVARQRRLAAAQGSGVVVEGRDAGTVIFPAAPLKVFLTASVERRAERRRKDSAGSVDGESTQGLAARDRRDLERSASPLVPAPDAVCLDTSGLSFEQTVDALKGLALAALGSPNGSGK